MNRIYPLLATALLCLGLLQTGCVTVDVLGGGRSELEEKVVFGDSGPKILMLRVEGTISERASDPSFVVGGRESMVARLREVLDLAREDEDIEAVLLRIDSPGGSVTASEIVYQEVLRFKRERDVPVFAQFMGTAASGGYYVAMSADEVVAHPTTVTGSIGVIFLNVEVSGLMKKIGITDQTITAGEHKDAGTPLRPMTPEEQAHFQAVIDDMQDRFVTVVDEGRPNLTREQVEKLADGSIYSAEQARANGLVDRIAAIEDTIDAIEETTGNEEMRTVVYHRRQEWTRNFYNRPPMSPVIQIDLRSLLGPLGQPGFFYLWMPGR